VICQLAKQGRSAFVTFLMAAIRTLRRRSTSSAPPKAGATSSRSACRLPINGDGPSIQAAGLRALKAGMTLKSR
jgi:tryptophan synthase alpha chain